MTAVTHIAGQTWHARKGGIGNAFRYGVDYVLLDAEAPIGSGWLFGRNRSGLFSVHDSDHGGPPGQGRGARWLRESLAQFGVPDPARIELLAQPRILGHVFNPVSFWLCYDEDSGLRSVVAEVTNTYGDRHCYLCQRPDHAPIGPQDRLTAQKLLHVSPYQICDGSYRFRFDIRPDRIGIWIDLATGDGGVTATLTGRCKPLGLPGVLRAMLRRPLGSRRVLVLIHWQALKLWWKGARFRHRPEPPAEEISQ